MIRVGQRENVDPGCRSALGFSHRKGFWMG